MLALSLQHLKITKLLNITWFQEDSNSEEETSVITRG